MKNYFSITPFEYHLESKRDPVKILEFMWKMVLLWCIMVGVFTMGRVLYVKFSFIIFQLVISAQALPVSTVRSAVNQILAIHVLVLKTMLEITVKLVSCNILHNFWEGCPICCNHYYYNPIAFVKILFFFDWSQPCLYMFAALNECVIA